MAKESTPAEDPLHDVVQEIEHTSPHLHHVNGPGVEEAHGKMAQGEGGVVKSEVSEAFRDELKADSCATSPTIVIGGSEEAFKQEDPMHDVKTEIETNSPRLRHVQAPDAPSAAVEEGGVVRSHVPEAFEEELKNDHDVAKGASVEDRSASRTLETKDLKLKSGCGTPVFRISAHHGMRPGGPLGRDVNSEAKEVTDGVSSGEAKPEGEYGSSTKVFPARGVPSRGAPTFRISAHHGMRPGGPISRDLKADSAQGGEESGADLSGGGMPKGPGLPSRGGLTASAPRRGGLARTGSGVPGEQKVVGASLARTGSGVPKGGDDLKDFSSFLDAVDVSQERQ